MNGTTDGVDSMGLDQRAKMQTDVFGSCAQERGLESM